MSSRTSSARRTGGTPPRPPAPGRGGWPVRERSLLRPVLGIPPVAALGIAVGATALGVLVDLLRIGTVGSVFQVGYLLGCVLAVGWVRRRGIFLPAVQPPLLLAVVVPLMAVLIGAPAGGGAAQSVLMAGAPLINAFPAMALTTAVVLLIAAFRLLRQRLGPDDAVGRLRVRLGRDPGGHDPDGPRRPRQERSREQRGDAPGGPRRSRPAGSGAGAGAAPPGRDTGTGRSGQGGAGRAGATADRGGRGGRGTDRGATGSARSTTGSTRPATGSARAPASGRSGAGGPGTDDPGGSRAGGARPSSTGGTAGRARRRSG